MPCTFLNSVRRPVVQATLRIDSDVMTLGDQRRAQMIVGTSLSEKLLIAGTDTADPGLDPRFSMNFSRLDLASEYLDRRRTFLASQEAVDPDPTPPTDPTPPPTDPTPPSS